MDGARRTTRLALIALAPALLAPARADGPGAAGRALAPFPLIRQPGPTSCGPTCAAMVLRHYGQSATPAWAALLRPSRRLILMSPPGLARLLSDHGVPARARRGALHVVVAALDGGRPAILLVRIGPRMWHYVVAVGHRDAGATFLLADPHGRLAWVDAADLERAWSFDGDLDGRWPGRPPCRACGGGPAAAACARCGGSGRCRDVIRGALGRFGLTPHLMVAPEQPPGTTSADRWRATATADSN